MINQPRSLAASGVTILNMAGSRIYQVYGNMYTWLTVGGNGFQPTWNVHNHYEVGVFASAGGSWWLATGTTLAPEWNNYGGGELVTGDNVNVQPGGIYRPCYLFYWITTAGLAASGLVPGQSHGWIDGYFPAASPPAQATFQALALG